MGELKVIDHPTARCERLLTIESERYLDLSLELQGEGKLIKKPEIQLIF